MSKLKVAFVCTGNSCRSQMAEGWARHLGKDIFEVYSAGTDPAMEVNPSAITVMQEVGVSLKGQWPKLLKDIPSRFDILITMGCGVQCPYIPSKLVEDWGLEDPVGKPLAEFRKTRDEIREKGEDLIQRVGEEF